MFLQALSVQIKKQKANKYNLAVLLHTHIFIFYVSRSKALCFLYQSPTFLIVET